MAALDDETRRTGLSNRGSLRTTPPIGQVFYRLFAGAPSL